MNPEIYRALSFAAGFNVEGYPTILDMDTHFYSCAEAAKALRAYCEAYGVQHPRRGVVVNSPVPVTR